MDMLNVQAVTHSPGRLAKFLTKIAAADDEEKLRLCPHDWGNIHAVAWLLIASWLFQTGLFCLVSHRLFASPRQLRPELVMGSMFIATFILLIDSYIILRSGWHLSGIAELKRGGLDISGGPIARIKAGFFLAIRIALSIGLAQLTAIFVSLLIFGADINSRSEKTYLQANSHLVGPAERLVDGGIQRAADALAAQDTRVTTLAAQVAALRQVEIDPSSSDPQIRQAQQEVSQLMDRKAKADEDVRTAETFASNEFGGIKGAAGNSGQPGRGLRYRAALETLANAKARAQEIARELLAARERLDALRKQIPRANDAIKQRSHDQLLTFETAFDAENAKQATLKDELAELTKGRENAIRKSVENAPDHVGYAGGFLAQISALEGIAKEDNKIAGILVLVELVSFGLELAAVLAKVTSYVPTAYAALLARDAYMRAVRIVDDMMAELKAIDDQAHRQPEIMPPEKPLEKTQSFGLAPGQDPFGSSGDAPSQPPKRKRGRPRKIIP